MYQNTEGPGNPATASANEREATIRRRANPWPFFAATFLLSWLFWVPAAVLSQRGSAPPDLFLLMGGFGPSIVGVAMIYWTQDRAGRIDYLRRAFGFRRIGPAWYVFILLVFPALAALSIGIDMLAGNPAPFFPDLAALLAEPQMLMLLPLIALQVALMGPLSEELGWRGYALDALQTRWSALASGLVIGLAWSVWHLPLFFIQVDTSFYYEWGFGSTLFRLFLLRMTLISVLMTWVYNNNRRSILSAILFHFAYNFTFSLLYPISEAVHLYGTILTLILAIGVALIWGPQTLARRRKRGRREPAVT
jgi:membrane protease YdiL (CAAX protease family)